MSLTNCPKCRSLFVKEKWDICPKCRKEENDELETLKNRIMNNPAITGEELALASGIPHARITDYIRNNRLSSVDAPLLKAACEICGAKVEMGRFCKNCSGKLVDGLQDVSSKMKKS